MHALMRDTSLSTSQDAADAILEHIAKSSEASNAAR